VETFWKKQSNHGLHPQNHPRIAKVGLEVAKRSELHQFAVIPKRWVVERSIAWMDKCRRLWKNCGRKLETSPASMRLAFIPLLLKKIKTGSKTLSWGSEAATAPHCFGFVVQ